MAEVAALKKALSGAEDKAAAERIEREKQDARVGEVQQELQELGKKFESLERDFKTKESELAKALVHERRQARSPKGPAGNPGGQEDSGG